MKTKLICMLGVIAWATVATAGPRALMNDDDEQAVVQDIDVEVIATDAPEAKKKKITVVAATGGSHWIGVYAIPVDAALQSHLRIKDQGLIVQQVMDESPAKKAGLQEHDVILKYGNAAVATVEDLIKAVAEAKDQETSVALIRAGKKMSLKVTGEERPKGQHAIAVTGDLGDVKGVLGNWFFEQDNQVLGQKPLKFRVVGPGVVDRKVNVQELHQALSAAKAKLPQKLTIDIEKKGDAAATITVTRDGETWTVTEESIDELPADVKPHVEGSLGRRAGVAIGFRGAGQTMQLKALQLYPSVKAARESQEKAGKGAAVRSIQIRQQQSDASTEVEALRKDLEELKAAVKELRSTAPKRAKRVKKNDSD